MNDVVIVMPVMNSGEHLRHALNSILRNTAYPSYRIIIVESESNDGTAELCDEYAKFNPKITVYHTKREGITKAINFAINKTTYEDVYLTQDDVLFVPLYKRDLISSFAKYAEKEDIGLITVSNGWGTSGKDYSEGFNWFGTWSLYIPRRTIEKVGLLDENFSPGPGDDIDYSYRVEKAGLFRSVLNNNWVDHHRLTENFNDHIEDVKQRNAKYFREKHKIDN